MARTRNALLVAGLLVGGAALAGGAPPAGADYVPFTIVDPTQGPPGTVITAKGDTWCATTTQEPGQNIQPGIPGSVVVEFGTLAWPPDLGTEAELDEVLVTTNATVGSDGMWSATITIPEGTPPGQGYGVLGHCTVEYEAETTTTTEPPSTSTSSSIVDIDPPAAGAGGRELAQLSIDFYPARFEVLPAAEVPVTTTTTTPTAAAPANAVPGQAGYTG